MNMFEANCRKVSDSLNNTVRLAAEYGDDSTKNVKLYTDLVERICEIESKITVHRKAMSEASREQFVDSFNKRYDAGMDKKKPQVRGQKRFKDFLQYAKPLLNPTLAGPSQEETIDDELIIEGDVGNLVDPITKRPLVIPVRNKQCNHVYEKSAIEEMLQMNRKTRCPVMGCAAQGFVQPQLLEVDVKLQQQLMQNRTLVCYSIT
ncbi:E3 SUMO-protein ligase NSE2-like isoform X2 [Anopheles coustani]|uniref:E3 SUMO-protein ligase NSE2-like isoform X2 n=1 Tax=Anopheles coustani TaxID=139045 RepID=UPI00265919E5|nr:E3 SUMO-protein ligase NSE2-like isoform X2 [Anopheles coustani]